MTAPCDVVDPDALKAAMQSISESLGRAHDLRGLVQAVLEHVDGLGEVAACIDLILTDVLARELGDAESALAEVCSLEPLTRDQRHDRLLSLEPRVLRVRSTLLVLAAALMGAGCVGTLNRGSAAGVVRELARSISPSCDQINVTLNKGFGRLWDAAIGPGASATSRGVA